jgi:hypothetical protein
MRIRAHSKLVVAAILVIVVICGGLYYLWSQQILDPFQRRIPRDAFKLIGLNEVPGENAIVFVHGLDGDPIATFQSARESPGWFELMKSDTRPFPGVSPPPPLASYSTYSLDYRRLFASENTVEDAAQQIADYLRSQDTFRKYNHVWFIAHSLGGILVKRMMLIYAGQDSQRLLNRISGVFLMGVPSQGSPLADLSQKDAILLLTTVIGRRYRVVKDLRPEEAATFLNVLDNSWGDFLRRRQVVTRDWPPFIYCAYEIDNSFRLAAVVPRLYAQTLCAENAAPMSTNHADLVKPSSVTSQVYTWVRDRIGRGAERTRRWPLVGTAPGLGTLGDLVRRHQELHVQPPDDSGLLEVPEEISFEDDKSAQLSSRLALRQLEYEGSTVADVYDRIAIENPCVSIAADASRHVLKIAVSDEVERCPIAGQDRIVCKGVPCAVRK